MKILTIASIICIFLTSRWLIRGSHGATPIINALNVKCDETGMKVNIDFDSPFSGIIFSKGHYSSKDCRYVNGDSLDRSGALKSFYFVIPSPGKCGSTSPSSVINNFIQFQNTIIIQADPLIQRSSDSIKKITCNWKPNIEKNVSMSSVNVASELNEVEEVIFTDDSGSRVETWMDLTDGEANPFGKSINSAVAVGSKLTLAIYIKDLTGDFDLKVKECFAYEEQEVNQGYIRTFNNGSTELKGNRNNQQQQFNPPSLKLTQDGCSLKKELIDDFTKLTSNSLRRLQAQMMTNGQSGSSNRVHNLNSNSKLYEATAIAYSTLSVFKFPERTSLSFSCNIQLCKFKCSEMCPSKSTRKPSESTGQLSPLIASSSSSLSLNEARTSSSSATVVNSTAETNGPLKTKELTSGQLTSNKSHLNNQKVNHNLNDNNNNSNKGQAILSEFKDVPNDSPMVSLLPLVLNHTIYYTKSLEFDSNGLQVKKANSSINGTRLKRQMNMTSKSLVIADGQNGQNGPRDNNNNRATKEEGDVNVKRTLKVIAPNFDEPDVINSLFQKYFTTSSDPSTDGDVLDLIVCFPITCFVTGHTNQTKYQFKIPIKGCGTSRVNIDIEEESIDIKGFENIIVIQNNPAYQAINDSVRMIVCRYTAALMDGPLARQSMDKRILFKPFTVDMLDVINVPMSGPKEKHHSVSCWMDITRGTFPHARAIEGPVKVGENLTMAIYIKDRKETTDLRVKDCYAYDSREDAIGGGKPVIQLTSEMGCPLNNKLIGHWKTTTNTGTSGASVLAYATVSAFKFPEKENVFLSCNVELCTNGCLTFCNEEASHLSPNFSLDHKDNSTNSSPSPSFSSSSLPSSSVMTTVTTTVTTPSSVPSHEVEFDLIDTRKPNRVAPQSIRRIPSASNSDRVEHETNDDDIGEVDVLSEESPSVRNAETMDLARLLFQGEVTTPPPSTDSPSTSSDEMTTTSPGDSTSAATTTPSSSDMASSTSNAETTMADGSTTTPSSNTEAKMDSEATTTPASSDDKANSTETTAAIISSTESTDQVKDGANATSDADDRGRAAKGGSASDEESKGKSNEATPLIRMEGIKGGIKGVKGKNKISSPAAQLRKFPAFIPRRKPSSPVNGRTRSQSSSSSSRRRSNRRSNSNSRTNRRARHQSSNGGTSSNNNNNRPQRRSSSGSSGAESRNSWRMEPLPAKFDTGLADVPFRSTGRRLRSRPSGPGAVGVVAQ